jgi:hypothetical protein
MDVNNQGLNLPSNLQNLDVRSELLSTEVGSGASCAYSLRDLTGNNLDCVRVRREPEDSTNAIDDEKKFACQEVQAGYVEDWVNGKLENTLPCDIAPATSAYSLRKVRANYANDAVRIRRSSDDVEVDVAFDSEGKVSASSPITDGGTELTPDPDADLGSTTATTLGDFISGTDAFVHTWYDQAGSNNAVQDIAGNQPKIAESGALLADGLKFNGNSDNFTITNGVSGRSIFAVTNQNIDTTAGGVTGYGQDGISSLLGTTATDSYIFVTNNNSAFNSYAISIDGAVSDSGQYASNGKTLSSAGGNLGTYGDIPSDTNSLLSIIYGSGDPANAWTRLGSGGNGTIFMQGSMSEVILYTSDESDNRFKIESNINNYYGLYNDANETNGDFDKTFSPTADGTFTPNGKDGFTLAVLYSTVYAGIKLNEDVASGDSIYVSFNCSFDAGSPSPKIVLRNTDSDFFGSGIGMSNEENVVNGFNSFTLISNNSSASGVVLSEADNQLTYSISDFKVSRIARNGFVETWYDQSGNGNNASKNTASNQPSIISNGNQVTLDNGTPSIAFQRVSNIYSLSISTPIANEPYTFFATTVNNASNAYFRLFGQSNSAPTVLLKANNNIAYAPSDSDSSGDISATTTSDNIVSGFSGVNGGADGILRFNGTNLKTDISRTQDGDSISLIGRFPNVGARFAHIESLVFYESDLTADFDTIEKELAQPINIL